jgi:hypothetical protein
MSGSDSTYLAPFGDGSSVLERVLLAIIKHTRRPRPKAVSKSGWTRPWRRLSEPVTDHERQIEQAIRYMARERQRDICEAEMAAIPCSRTAATTSARSIAQLAEVAARKVLGCSTPAELRASCARSLVSATACPPRRAR